MAFMSLRNARTALAAAALLTLATALNAQAPYLGDRPVPAVWLELMYPSWDDAPGYSAMLFSAGGRIRVGENIAVIAEVPFATSSEDFGDDGFMVGNPYLGLRQRFMGSGVVEIGGRIPVVGDSAPSSTQIGGVIGDYDRFEAYASKVWTLRGDVAYDGRMKNGIRLVAGGGPSYMIPDQGDDELFLDYRAGVGVGITAADFMVWFTGRWNATNDGATFNEASVHQVTVSATGAQGRFRPAVYIRLPMDSDLNDMLKMTLGVGLTYGF